MSLCALGGEVAPSRFSEEAAEGVETLPLVSAGPHAQPGLDGLELAGQQAASTWVTPQDVLFGNTLWK